MDYESIAKSLDPGERIIYLKQYLKTPWLYDKVIGVVHLLSRLDQTTGETTLDIVDDRWLGAALVRHPDYQIRDRMLLVRLRSGDGVSDGWLITREELDLNKSCYTVLDVYILVVSKESPFHTRTIGVQEWQSCKGDYDVVDVGYMVATHSPDKVRGIFNDTKI